LIYDYRQADLPPRERALCDYAVKMTLTPGNLNEGDIEALRAHAWSDEQIACAVQVIGYFNYINRLADGLGVDLEPWMTSPTRQEWLARRGDRLRPSSR